MSLAHRLKQLESLRALPDDAVGKAQAIKAVEAEIQALRKEAGVPDGAKFRETPKPTVKEMKENLSKVGPVKKTKVSKPK